MKIDPIFYENYLKNKFENINIIFLNGTNVGLINLTYERTLKILEIDINDPFNVSKIGSEEFRDNPSLLHDNINTLNVFSEKRFILLDLMHISINKSLEDIILETAKIKTLGFKENLEAINPKDIKTVEDLQKIPVLRKSELSNKQKLFPPFGGFERKEQQNTTHFFQSPGPIYEPGTRGSDWGRFAPFLYATGVRKGMVLQNCFSYHLTPAGMMFEEGALKLGTKVIPAGTGQTELQAKAASFLKTNVYAGTPDFLLKILEKGDELNLDLTNIKIACVGGGPLFPDLRKEYADRGIKCMQSYATADLGNIALETVENEPLIIDEGVIVEIVFPGTGEHVGPGEIGEILVTSLNLDYPLIRFATGDMSAFAPGKSKCGRTNTRIVGWRGRADQAAKVKGMFLRPEQIKEFISRNKEILKVRAEISLLNNQDDLTIKIEVNPDNSFDYTSNLRDIINLRANIIKVKPNSLPKDGVVIDDKR